MAPTRRLSGLLARQQIGLFLEPSVFVGLLLFTPFSISSAKHAALASPLWIATWWVTEAIPISATSLLPIILFPLTGVVDIAAATAPYADPVVFLLLGGFLLVLGIERWDLHRRIALAYSLFKSRVTDTRVPPWTTRTNLLDRHQKPAAEFRE